MIGTKGFGPGVQGVPAARERRRLAAIFGEPDFSDLSFTINGSEFCYGIVINALITFLLVGATVFFVVVKPINALMARRKKRRSPSPRRRPRKSSC
jgi:large conductance mechanosensitive channel